LKSALNTTKIKLFDLHSAMMIQSTTSQCQQTLPHTFG